MMENKALKGYQNERDFVVMFNQNPEIINKFNIESSKNLYAIHIISHKYGKVNEASIACKADFYIAEGDVDNEYLKNCNYYLDEKDVVKFNLKPIDYSGVSVKLKSSNYTIFKMSPNTFEKLFGSNILAAGASIYSTKDFHKNESVLQGWGVNKQEFETYFSQIINNISNYLEDKKILGKIKKEANFQISNYIKNNKELSNFIFMGIGNFEEPYTAPWLIEDDSLKPNYEIPFNVTTGSGRSKGIFTIVLKPL